MFAYLWSKSMESNTTFMVLDLGIGQELLRDFT